VPFSSVQIALFVNINVYSSDVRFPSNHQIDTMPLPRTCYSLINLFISQHVITSTKHVGIVLPELCPRACVCRGKERKQVGQLSQANRAAACIRLGKNVSVKSEHRSILRH